MRLTHMMIAALALTAATSWPARGDLFRMADGSHRLGRIMAQSTNHIDVMIDTDGMRSLVRIPRAELYYIVPAGTTDPLTGQAAPAQSRRTIALLSDVPDVVEKPAEPATQSGSIILKGPAPASSQASAKPTKKLAPASPEFFTGLGKLLAGQGGDLGDPATLSTQNRKYWDAILAAEESGDKRAALDNMIALAKAYERQPARLNLLAMRAKTTPFSTWMAQTRWDVWMSSTRRQVFDISSVTEIERYELIYLLRGKTQEALEPLKSYFPPEQRPRATSGPSSPPLAPTTRMTATPMSPANNPLNGITVANTLEVREKALYAAAILGAQMRLEPDMPSIDRLFLAEQSRNVQAVLARTTQTLPGALAAKEKADREKRQADERAARQPR